MIRPETLNEEPAMDLSGAYSIDAPREAVWRALNDPLVLKQCIPRCHTLIRQSDTLFLAELTAKIGPVKARFRGKLTLSDLDPPQGYTLSGAGEGGIAGFANGRARVRLEAMGQNRTLLSYALSAATGGKLARLGTRLMEIAAQNLADDFFGMLKTIVEAGASTPETRRIHRHRAPILTAIPELPPPPSLATIWWISGLILLNAALLYIFAVLQR